MNEKNKETNENSVLYLIHDDNYPEMDESLLTEEQLKEYKELKIKYGIK